MLIPRPNYLHLARMTDDTAVFKHAWFCVPRWEHGYCVDDDARALIICSLADRTGEVAGQLDHPSQQLRLAASHLFARNAPTFHAEHRSVALACLGAVEACVSDETPVAEWHAGACDATSPSAAEAGAHLLRRLTPLLARAHCRWPQQSGPGAARRRADAARVALPRGMERDPLQLHDAAWAGEGRPSAAPGIVSQQPIEAASMADACWRAWKVTGDARWAERTVHAAARFLGCNDAGLRLYDAQTGAGAGGRIAPAPSEAYAGGITTRTAVRSRRWRHSWRCSGRGRSRTIRNSAARSLGVVTT